MWANDAEIESANKNHALVHIHRQYLDISLFQALKRLGVRELLKILNFKTIHCDIQRKLFITWVMPPIRRRNAKEHSNGEQSSHESIV